MVYTLIRLWINDRRKKKKRNPTQIHIYGLLVPDIRLAITVGKYGISSSATLICCHPLDHRWTTLRKPASKRLSDFCYFNHIYKVMSLLYLDFTSHKFWKFYAGIKLFIAFIDKDNLVFLICNVPRVGSLNPLQVRAIIVISVVVYM